MDILIGLVVAMFIITAAFVGYHASQEPVDAGGHNVEIDLEIMNQSFKSNQVTQYYNIYKNIA